MITPDGVFQIIAGASNIKTGGNTEYTATDFLLMYPQFGVKKNDDDVDPMLITEVVPRFVIDAWVKLMHRFIKIGIMIFGK